MNQTVSSEPKSVKIPRISVVVTYVYQIQGLHDMPHAFQSKPNSLPNVLLLPVQSSHFKQT